MPKIESLEIDLEAERIKAATAEVAKHKADEARDIRTSALNVAQNNYAEAQSIVHTLTSEVEWMRDRGVILEFDVSHCSVADQANAALARAEGVYDHLSMSVMHLVAEARKHDDWCQRLKTI
ncbi:hypothetical protein Hanom_Chr07g00603271 [Helianthus anomalus]